MQEAKKGMPVAAATGTPSNVDWAEAPPAERTYMSNFVPPAYASCHKWRYDPNTGEVLMEWTSMLESLDFSRLTMLIFVDLDQCPDFGPMQRSFDPGVVIIGCHGSSFPSKRMAPKGRIPSFMQVLINNHRLLLVGAGNGDQAADVAIGALAQTFALEYKDQRVVLGFVSNDQGFIAHALLDGLPTALLSPNESMDTILDDAKAYWIEKFGTEPVSDKNAGTPADMVAEPEEPGSVGTGVGVLPASEDKTLVTPVSTASEDAAEEGKAQPQVGNKRGREGEGNEDGEEGVGAKRLKDT